MNKIAYFSMEIGLKTNMKTYAGGLGILAGDTLKSCADKGLDMVGISLLYKYGYFKQNVDDTSGEQKELHDNWDYKGNLRLLDEKVELEILGKKVIIQVWEHRIIGNGGHEVSVYFLDTDTDDNEQDFRYVSYSLYTRYENTRMLQEIVLGAGGVLVLERLGLNITKYHLNESHAAFAVFPLEEKLQDKQEVKRRIVFTTHTPVKHGHRGYDVGTYKRYLPERWFSMLDQSLEKDGKLLLTDICLTNANYANGVSKKHREVTSDMFDGHKIDYVTNGIHHLSWVTKSFEELYDSHFSSWKANPLDLRNAVRISNQEIYEAHQKEKEELIHYIQGETKERLYSNVFTIGFARRVDTYKRSDFILRDIERLKYIAGKFPGVQIVFAGKAFPDDYQNESTIERIYKLAKEYLPHLNVVYLEDYSMEISKKMVGGCDIWLNNPLRPLEASGTSGMKAALNGVPNFSVVDGWWVEGCIEGITGWAIGNENGNMGNESYELNELYNKLENVILPTYYFDSKKWIEIQKNAIAMNASYFNTHRMIDEYITKAYFL